MLKRWKKRDDNVVEITNTDLKFSKILNAIQQTFSRRFGSSTFGISPDGKRDYNALYGYGTSLSFDDYWGMYKRGGIAKNIVEKVVKASWRNTPKLMVGDTEVLEKEMVALKNAGLFKYLERADILNRIGNFSVMVIGVPDGLDLDKPLGTNRASNAIEKLYFRPYSYGGTEIVGFDKEPSSDRYGEPVAYQVQTLNMGDKDKEQQVDARKVHWSRVVHIAEGALDSDIEGSPALEAGWNCLTDKEKIRGGGGEAYYRNARQKFALEVDKDATMDTSTEGKAALKDEVESFSNNLQDFMRLKGMKANAIQPNMASPRDIFDVCVEELAGIYDTPVRVLTGKGGGNLAGSEDRASWNSTVQDRQESFCTGLLLRSLEILNEAGMIKLPDGVEVVWKPQESLSEKEASEVTLRRSQALNNLSAAIANATGETVDMRSALDDLGFGDVDLDAIELIDENGE